MNKLSLVIMAAGMGSRFGGLKQLESVGPNNELLIEYSVFDAVKAGFNDIVIIIKKENEELFKEKIEGKFPDNVSIRYVYQDINDIPCGITLNKERTKPWGTAHAIRACKDVVSNSFVIINADDYYGPDAYKKAFDYLKGNKGYCLVGYEILKTLSENGAVKRGICLIENGCLRKLIESNVNLDDNNNIIASPLSGDESFIVNDDSLCSMNMLGFDISIFKYLDEMFVDFLNKNKEDIENCEFLIPDVLYDLILNLNMETNVLATSSTWLGITYKDDLENVKGKIKLLHDNEEYPKTLW